LRSHWKFTLILFTPPALLPHDIPSLPALLLVSTLLCLLGPFATGPQAAMRQQHDTDCTVHEEPAMLKTPLLKHSAHSLQGLAWQSIDPEPSE